MKNTLRDKEVIYLKALFLSIQETINLTQLNSFPNLL